ncbi:MAG TPA: tripartite tricarboxylate transporter substrate binding protein [Burkholderiales bacterium]|nr:tripartite tricarboxylate transporter substrate binding protein [Burkholderiales bacterium]
MHGTIWAAACVALTLAATGACAAQQTYPNKPVRVVFAFAAGGAGDIIGRAYGQKFTEKFGQAWVLDNRGGAGSTIGTDIAAKAAPDGYTLFQANMTLCVSYAAYAKLPYDPVRDFVPITTTVNVTSFLAITPSLPVGNVKELIAYVKARPGQLSYASAGQGSTSHFSAEMFNRMAGIQMAHVPYKGTGPALPDLLAGRVHLIFEPIVTMLPHVRAGRMKALGVTSLKRSIAAPDIPSLAEQGMDGYDVVLWYGMLAPTGTPRPIVDKLHAAFVEFAASPDIKEKLSGIGAEPGSTSQAEFAAIIKRDLARWKKVAAEAGIRL